METFVGLPDMLQKILLSCGVLAAGIYLGTDLLAGRLIKGYSFSVQSMGELGAAGSPTRPLVIVLAFVASAFMIAFGIGIWRAAGPAILPRIVAVLILGNAIAGLAATSFFPNHFGVRPEFGTPGVLLMFISVLCFVLAMVLGAAAFHGWMRILSVPSRRPRPPGVLRIALRLFRCGGCRLDRSTGTDHGLQLLVCGWPGHLPPAAGQQGESAIHIGRWEKDTPACRAPGTTCPRSRHTQVGKPLGGKATDRKCQ
jgi:hypothetical protein